MFGPFSTRRGATLYLLVWLMLGLVLAALVANAAPAAAMAALLFALPLTLLYAVAAGFSTFYLCRAFPLGGASLVQPVGAFVTAGVFASAAWTSAAIAWNGMLSSSAIPLDQPLRVMLFGFGVVLYGLTAVAQYLIIEFDRKRSAERRELESKLMAQEAELRMLRTQVDPHFLFNSLNSISALTSLDPARAREMTLRLSDFFRHSLRSQQQSCVTVSDEARVLSDFLAIEKVRFGARLGVEQEIEAEAQACLLPPMILQPLVENAVKHGIGGLPEGGTVRITARRTGSILRLAVENDVDEDTPSRKGNGIGLANVRQRLATSYGHEASIHWSRENKRFRVELTLPARTEGD